MVSDPRVPCTGDQIALLSRSGLPGRRLANPQTCSPSFHTYIE